MKVKQFYLVVALILCAVHGIGQTISNVEFQFTVAGAAEGEEVYIGYYYGSSQYISDTLTFGPEGKFTLKKDELDVGIYLLVFEDESYAEFLVNEPRFSVFTTRKDPAANLRFEGSTENQLWQEMQKFVADLRSEQAELEIDMNLTPAAKESKEEQLKQKSIEHQEKFLKEHPSKLVATILKANQPVQEPDIPGDLTPDEAKSFHFYFYKAHFLDQIDFTKSTLLHTPIYNQKLIAYLDQLTYQTPDSLIAACDYFIGRSKENPELFKFTVLSLLNRYAESNRMCFDAVYVHLAEKYYLSGQADWISDEMRANLQEIIPRQKTMLCGSRVANITLSNMHGNERSLYAVKADLIVLIFYEAGEESGQKIVTELQAIQQEIKTPFGVVAVSVNTSKESWLKFVANHDLPTWIHLNDSNGKERYRDSHNLTLVSSEILT